MKVWMNTLKAGDIIMELNINGPHITKTFGTNIFEIREKLEVSWQPSTGVVAIGINPSEAGKLDKNAKPHSDRTVSMLANFLNKKGFSKCTMINLFECVTPDQKDIDQRTETDFQKHISLFESAGIILIIWGIDDNYKKQKKNLYQILQNYNNKLYCIKDEKGKYPRHPSRMSYDDSVIVKCKINDNMNLTLE